MSVKTELERIWEILSHTTNIPLLFVAITLGSIGGIFLAPLFSQYFGKILIDYGISPTLVSAAIVLFSLCIGYLSDRYGRRKVIVGSSFLMTFLTPLYLVFHKVPGLTFVYLPHLLASRGNGLATEAMIGDAAPKRGRATLYGFYSFIEWCIPVVLSASGMAAALKMESSILFSIGFGFLILSSVLLAIYLKETIKEKAPQEQSTDQGHINESEYESGPESGPESEYESGPESEYLPGEKFLERLSISAHAFMRTHMTILTFFLFYFFFRASASYDFLRFLMMSGEASSETAFLSFALAIYSAAFFALQPFGGWLSDWLEKRKSVIMTGLMIMLIFNVLMAVSPGIRWSTAFWVLAVLGEGMIIPVVIALMVDIVPPWRLGISFGVLVCLSRLGNELVSPLCRYVTELHGAKWTFPITIGLLVVSLLVM